MGWYSSIVKPCLAGNTGVWETVRWGGRDTESKLCADAQAWAYTRGHPIP